MSFLSQPPLDLPEDFAPGGLRQTVLTVGAVLRQGGLTLTLAGTVIGFGREGWP